MGSLRKHAELPVDHDDHPGVLDHILHLEAGLWEPFDGPAIESGDLPPSSHNPVARTSEREHARALEDRIVGVVSHDAIRVPAVPALQPILHEAEVRHASPLPSRLRVVAARALLPPTSTGMLPARFDARAGSSERVQGPAAQRLSRRGVLVTPGAHGVRSPPHGRHGAAARAGQRRIRTRAGRGAAAEHAQPEPVPVPGSYDLPRTRRPVARQPAFPADPTVTCALCLLLGGGWRNPVGEPPLRTARSPWWARYSLHRHADDLSAHA